jgi:ATP-dependent Lon protease
MWGERMPVHPRVLVVEDDRLLRMDLALVLGREGISLDVAACAQEAYAFLDRSRYDLVLTDVKLPDDNGYDVLRAAKRSDPSTKVVLVTGSHSATSPAEIDVEGAESLILKPFALAELIEVVHRLLPGGWGRLPRTAAAETEPTA